MNPHRRPLWLPKKQKPPLGCERFFVEGTRGTRGTRDTRKTGDPCSRLLPAVAFDQRYIMQQSDSFIFVTRSGENHESDIECTRKPGNENL